MERCVIVVPLVALCGHVLAATLHEEMVPMRDGVRLFTRAMVLGEGKDPCVFSRTPYPRGNALKSPYPQELVDRDAAPGAEVKVAVKVALPADAKACHPVLVEVYDPNGGAGSYAFRTALNAPKGT